MKSSIEKIIRPIVEGQIRGFLKEHPRLIDAVDWYKPRHDKSVTFTNSLAKRIVRDLTCRTVTARLVVALLESEPEVSPNSTVEPCDCGERGSLGMATERSTQSSKDT